MKGTRNAQSKNGKVEFLNLQMLAYWDDVVCCMLAFCACLGSLKFFKILQFNRSISTLFRTFRMGFTSFAAFGFIFALLVFAWLQLGFVIFSESIQGFSTFVKTIETGFLLVLGKMQLKTMMSINFFWTIVFHLTFNFCMVFVMLNMFVSLITQAFTKAKKYEVDADPLHLEEYIYTKISSPFEYFIKKFTAKDEEKKLSDHERKMRQSLGFTDMYEDEVGNLVHRADRVVHVFNKMSELNSKEEKMKKYNVFQLLKLERFI